MHNRFRTRRLIAETIDHYQLDLSGLVVLTEAASNNYMFTPVVAAMAGAKKVYAVAKDSRYATAVSVTNQSRDYAQFCEVDDRIDFVNAVSPEILSSADLVTNLGFVRPINREFISGLNKSAVISLMVESWEYRESDVDLKAAREFNIPVMGVREDLAEKSIFDFSGPLCIKMLFDAQIEVLRSRLVVASRDKFGKVICRYLKSMGAEISLVEDLKTANNIALLKNADALIVADYTSPDLWVGQGGHISADELAKNAPGITVVNFSGNVASDELKKNDIAQFPEQSPGSFRMARTLADIGPKPVIELHSAGLKVGELMARTRKALDPAGDEFLKKITENPLVMPL